MEYLWVSRDDMAVEALFMAVHERLELNRQFLSQAIVEAVRSWPESDRKIFVQAHYEGKSAEDISDSSSLELADVLQILEICEWRLSKSLKAFYAPLQEIARRSPDVSALRTSN